MLWTHGIALKISRQQSKALEAKKAAWEMPSTLRVSSGLVALCLATLINVAAKQGNIRAYGSALMVGPDALAYRTSSAPILMVSVARIVRLRNANHHLGTRT